MEFDFDLAEPLQTTRTNHQRNFSQSLLSNIKFEPRTAEQREADARRNAPKYARERAVGSILTARFLVAKKAFDSYWGYNIDDAWDGDAGAWRDGSDPWLRAPEGDTVAEFLRGYTKARAEEKQPDKEAGVPDKEPLSVDELEALALAVVRVARVDLEAAGRDNGKLDADFKKGVLEVVAQLKTEYDLPQSAPEVEEDEEEEEEAGAVNGA